MPYDLSIFWWFMSTQSNNHGYDTNLLLSHPVFFQDPLTEGWSTLVTPQVVASSSAQGEFHTEIRGLDSNEGRQANSTGSLVGPKTGSAFLRSQDCLEIEMLVDHILFKAQQLWAAIPIILRKNKQTHARTHRECSLFEQHHFTNLPNLPWLAEKK